jgi:hypothetical protein
MDCWPNDYRVADLDKESARRAREDDIARRLMTILASGRSLLPRSWRLRLTLRRLAKAAILLCG